MGRVMEGWERWRKEGKHIGSILVVCNKQYLLYGYASQQMALLQNNTNMIAQSTGTKCFFHETPTPKNKLFSYNFPYLNQFLENSRVGK